VWFYIIVFVFGPLLIIAWQSLMLRDGDYSLANLTLHYWNGAPTKSIGEGEPGILLSPSVQGAAWNSVRLSIVTAIICAFLGLMLGYAIVKGRGTRLSRIVEQVSFLPFVIPSIAFGAIYLSMFASTLYGTFALIVLVSVVSHLPYSSRTGSASIMQIGGELVRSALWLPADVHHDDARARAHHPARHARYARADDAHVPLPGTGLPAVQQRDRHGHHRHRPERELPRGAPPSVETSGRRRTSVDVRMKCGPSFAMCRQSSPTYDIDTANNGGHRTNERRICFTDN
jgi:hypothetical protein